MPYMRTKLQSLFSRFVGLSLAPRLILVILSAASSALSQPQVVSVSPASGTGTSQTFTFVYSDPLGEADLASVFAVFNNSAPASVSVADACDVQLDLIHNQILLADDGGT